jgi:hypothetical protein
MDQRLRPKLQISPLVLHRRWLGLAAGLPPQEEDVVGGSGVSKAPVCVVHQTQN